MTVMDRSKSDGDAALVEALRREDPEAPEQLVETYGDRVYRLALRITGSNEDAEEAAQDALWTAARKISTFKGESAFGSWLYRIAANAAYQKLRARRPSKTHEIAIDEVLPAFDDDGRHFEPMADWSDRVDEQALQGELRRVLGSAIDGLPPDYRTALVLHDVCEGWITAGRAREVYGVVVAPAGRAVVLDEDATRALRDATRR